MAEDINIFDFVPVRGTESANLVVTNLDLYGMPLIRYEVGDLVSAHRDSTCSCGCRFARLDKIEGRIFDTVILADGREVSPIHLTDAVELVRSVRRYQIVQDDIDDITVRVQLFDGDCNPPADEIRQVLAPYLGPTASIKVDLVANMDPPPGSKFRTVDNRLRRRRLN